LLPNRLAYPEHIPADLHTTHLYETPEDLLQKLRSLLIVETRLIASLPGKTDPALRDFVSRNDWRRLVPQYDQTFEQIRKNYG